MKFMYNKFNRIEWSSYPRRVCLHISSNPLFRFRECTICGLASTVLTNIRKSDLTQNFDMTRLRTIEHNMYVGITIRMCRNANLITFCRTTQSNSQKHDNAESHYFTTSTRFKTNSFQRVIVAVGVPNFRRTSPLTASEVICLRAVSISKIFLAEKKWVCYMCFCLTARK